MTWQEDPTTLPQSIRDPEMKSNDPLDTLKYHNFVFLPVLLSLGMIFWSINEYERGNGVIFQIIGALSLISLIISSVFYIKRLHAFFNKKR